jgi:hypothetical protein
MATVIVSALIRITVREYVPSEVSHPDSPRPIVNDYSKNVAAGRLIERYIAQNGNEVLWDSIKVEVVE